MGGEVTSEMYVVFRGHDLTIFFVCLFQITLLFTFLMLFQCAVFSKKQRVSCHHWFEYSDCKKLCLHPNPLKILGSAILFAAL